MADKEFERFKKMYPGGRKDMNVLAIPAPLPGPGGIGRAIIGKGVQSGIRRFGDVTKGDKTTRMKTREGLERKDPMEPRVVPSGRSKELEKVRQGGGGPTKMKDRKGLEMKPPVRASERPPSRGMGIAKGAAVSSESKSKPLSNAEVQKSYQEVNRKHGTQRPVTEVQRAVPIPRQRPADLKTAKKPVKKGKSKTRIAFEKEFAAARRAGKKKFSSKLGKYGTYSTKLK